ncbi:sensor histidine kinase [Gordonia sp. CPCC 205515]|uniref:sensor histidine kinase n=1 Tax=Gordonia sp. CPCC 205515 TaxID=3140791 RepID=UPI003AF35C33
MTAPIMLLGTALLFLMRGMSLRANMVVIVLLPLVATFVGVLGVSGFMFTGDITKIATVLAAVALVTAPAALYLSRAQAKRTVWERQMRDQERAAERSRRELIAWVSHDLRTPLADIKALAEALGDSVVTSPDEVVDFAREIDVNTVRLSQMVDDLFEMSRIHSGALRLDFEPLDVREVVDEVAGALTAAARRAEVCLDVDLPPTAVPVVASSTALSRVLTNLVVNAIAHTPHGGSVRIQVASGGTDVTIGVTDTGGGIAEEDLPRIFEMAYRGTAARTPVNSAGLPVGSGMGLAIAQGLVAAHDGLIVASNTDAGSRFEVTLPGGTARPKAASVTRSADTHRRP